MSTPHALIVDDSKTAQLRLKRMLEAYDLHIDVVFSAEEALAYLSYRAPAVIFLDQSMRGMDGIEALKTIKANPATATIPVIMYTSEQGEVFTGQARALGALDILYKSSLRPSSLEKVLAALKITPLKGSTEKSTEKTAEQPQPAPTKTPPPPPPTPASAGPTSLADVLADVRQQIARLFEIHIADVGRQIDNSTQFITRRITAAAEQNQRPAEIVVGDVPLSVLNDEVTAERRRVSVVSHVLLSVLIVAVLALAGVIWQWRAQMSAMTESYQAAMTLGEMNANQIQHLTAKAYQVTRPESGGELNSQPLLQALNWAANTDLSFDVDEEPLNADIINEVQFLLTLLADSGFEGVVELKMHFANTCLHYNDGGNLVLAPDSLPMDDCVLRQSLNQSYDVVDHLSIPYLTLQQLSPALQEHNIELLVSSAGLDRPRRAYPEQGAVATAGDWNKTALQNNYISLAFHRFD